MAASDKTGSGGGGGSRWQARDLIELAPYNQDHWVAIRVALTDAVPLLILYGTGHARYIAYAVFAGLTASYARNAPHLSRLRIQSIVACVMVIVIALGGLTALSPGRDWLVVVGGMLVAGCVSLVGDRVRWAPGGPLLQLLAFAGIALQAVTPTVGEVGIGVAVAVVTAMWALLVSFAGRFIRNLRFVTGPTSTPPPMPAEKPLPHAILFAATTLVAGFIPTLFGIGHSYWAMIAVCAVLGPNNRYHRQIRGIQRVVGTVGGLGIGAILFSIHFSEVILVILVVVLTASVELFVLRNYALGLLFMTPMVLVMGQMGGVANPEGIIGQRLIETAIGVAVAIVGTIIESLIVRRFPQLRATDPGGVT